MAIKSFKCPSCGAGLSFKPEHNNFRCDYCLSEFTEKEISDLYKEEEVLESEVVIDQSHLTSYTCNSCGATVVTDDTTTSTFCYYCHNPVIISDRLAGDFRPDKMIPFTIDKEGAQKIFLDWVKDFKYVPKDFYSSSQLEKITGVYLPYWWADCVVEVDYLGNLEKEKVMRERNSEVTEISTYEIVRNASVAINNSEFLAFTKIDEKLLNGIGPYAEDKAVPFSMPYLSGFFAEQYNVSQEAAIDRIKDRVKTNAKTLVLDSVENRKNLTDVQSKIDIKETKVNYTLLPTWILTYNFNDKTYVFAVNGQSGKSFGELPIDNKKVLMSSMMILLIVMALMLIGGMWIW